ncbi:MAG: hypothetical protein HOH43_26365 [Candidatus Latescibacteria bacterium]|jgi:hypothetical protein|nr:hypothetical protein [Candidatus Latescibacterota bacterium]
MVPLYEIVVEAQSGDPYAFDQLVLRFQDMAVGYAQSILGDFHLAEDAAQNDELRSPLCEERSHPGRLP